MNLRYLTIKTQKQSCLTIKVLAFFCGIIGISYLLTLQLYECPSFLLSFYKDKTYLLLMYMNYYTLISNSWQFPFSLRNQSKSIELFDMVTSKYASIVAIF